jgi:hypothetical protein
MLQITKRFFVLMPRRMLPALKKSTTRSLIRKSLGTQRAEPSPSRWLRMSYTAVDQGSKPVPRRFVHFLLGVTPFCRYVLLPILAVCPR